jgi:plastocyanin
MHAAQTSSHRIVRRASTALLLAALTVGFVACGDDGGTASSTTTPGSATTAAGSATTAAASATTASGGAAPSTGPVVVVIKDVKYQNPDVTIKAGGQVTFDNQDTQPHTATGDDRSFDSGDIAAGAKKSITIAKAGSYKYHCSFHPFMTGTITVN